MLCCLNGWRYWQTKASKKAGGAAAGHNKGGSNNQEASDQQQQEDANNIAWLDDFMPPEAEVPGEGGRKGGREEMECLLPPPLP